MHLRKECKKRERQKRELLITQHMEGNISQFLYYSMFTISASVNLVLMINIELTSSHHLIKKQLKRRYVLLLAGRSVFSVEKNGKFAP